MKQVIWREPSAQKSPTFARRGAIPANPRTIAPARRRKCFIPPAARLCYRSHLKKENLARYRLCRVRIWTCRATRTTCQAGPPVLVVGGGLLASSLLAAGFISGYMSIANSQRTLATAPAAPGRCGSRLGPRGQMRGFFALVKTPFRRLVKRRLTFCVSAIVAPHASVFAASSALRPRAGFAMVSRHFLLQLPT